MRESSSREANRGIEMFVECMDEVVGSDVVRVRRRDRTVVIPRWCILRFYVLALHGRGGRAEEH